MTRPVPLLTQIVVLLLLAAPLSLAGDASPQGPPRIAKVALIAKEEALFAGISLAGGFTGEVVETVQSGLPVVFSYEAVLTRPRLVKDKEVARVRMERILTYDTLKDEYLISYGPGRPVFVTVKGIDGAESEVAHVLLKVTPLSRLRPGQLYRLRVRARVRKGEEKGGLPFGGLTRFFSQWGYKTPWKEISFSY